jgi:hypothetical protein
MNAKMKLANDKAREAILTSINDARLKAGLWAFEADELMIGIIRDKGNILIGIVMFKDHCVVPGSVKVFASGAFVQGIMGLGLSMDDFVDTQGV